MVTSYFKNSRILKNAGYIVAGKVARMIFSLIVGLLTARYLGPSNFGLINYAGAYVAFFTAFCTLGINDILVKEFIDYPGEEGKILGTTLVLRFVSSILSLAIIIAVVSVIDAGEKTTIVVVTLASLGMVLHATESFGYWFQSRLESKYEASTTLTAYILASAYKIFLLISGKSVEYFALVSSIEYLFFGVIIYRKYRKRGGRKLSFSHDYGRKLLDKSKHFILSGLMVSIYGQTDKLMLKQMLGQTEVGYYATATSLCNAWCFVLSAIIQSVYPSIMEAARERNESLFKKRNLQLYAIIFYVSVFVSISFTVLARPLIGIMYGRAYIPAVAPLRVITWYTAFSYLGVARNAWIVSKDRQKHLFKVYSASAVANVILNFILIPRFGTVGAAVASLTAQVFTTMVVPFLIKDLRENSMIMIDAILLKGILWGK